MATGGQWHDTLAAQGAWGLAEGALEGPLLGSQGNARHVGADVSFW